jgi:hypothetical protein
MIHKQDHHWDPTLINSSSAAEEQRRKGHHPGEERVEIVD